MSLEIFFFFLILSGLFHFQVHLVSSVFRNLSLKISNLVMPSFWWWARILCDNNISHPEGVGAKNQRLDGGNQHAKIIQVDDPFSKLLLSYLQTLQGHVQTWHFPSSPKETPYPSAVTPCTPHSPGSHWYTLHLSGFPYPGHFLQYVAFYGWLLLLNTTFSRFILRVLHSFFFLWSNNSLLDGRNTHYLSIHQRMEAFLCFSSLVWMYAGSDVISQVSWVHI